MSRRPWFFLRRIERASSRPSPFPSTEDIAPGARRATPFRWSTGLERGGACQNHRPVALAGTGHDPPAVILAPRPCEDPVSHVFLESAELQRLAWINFLSARRCTGGENI